MSTLALSQNFEELTFEELMSIDGGAWSWKDFSKATVGGAVGGAFGGAVVGAMAGGVGAGPGALAGGISGGLAGAVGYAVIGWW